MIQIGNTNALQTTKSNIEKLGTTSKQSLKRKAAQNYQNPQVAEQKVVFRSANSLASSLKVFLTNCFSHTSVEPQTTSSNSRTPDMKLNFSNLRKNAELQPGVVRSAPCSPKVNVRSNLRSEKTKREGKQNLSANGNVTLPEVSHQYPMLKGFVLEKSLQNGYSGKVYRGYQHSTQQKVVVKCCRKLSSWTTETRALSKLHHENIIKMVGTPQANVACPPSIKMGQGKNSNMPDENGAVPSIHVLAQELAENGDLYEFLQTNGPVDEPTARALIKPLVKALAYAYHRHGISHRDIKLENIFVMKDGTIKLGDWGLAAFDTKNRECSSSCGTLGYMAPEMVCRHKYDANKTDVWALAVVLFSLCTGVRPYAEPEHRQRSPKDFSWKDEWLAAMMEGRWKVWWMSHARTTKCIGKLSPDLRNMIEQMFDADSENRISLRELLYHPWMCKDGIIEEVPSDCESNSDEDTMMDVDGEYAVSESVVSKSDIARFCRKY